MKSSGLRPRPASRIRRPLLAAVLAGVVAGAVVTAGFATVAAPRGPSPRHPALPAFGFPLTHLLLFGR